ncbi:unnamed protein product, partial [Prorocentrum cordatum]
MVVPEAQMKEAKALHFPLRRAWMLLASYRQPRSVAAFGAVSTSVVAWQGNIAGLGRASSLLLLLLTLRALQRARAIAPTVTPRGLVDDVTLDWQGPEDESGGELAKALGHFTDSMENLKLALQPEKSGHLASSRRRARILSPRMQWIGLKGELWACNLGHELHSRKVGHDAAASSGTPNCCPYCLGDLPLSAGHGAGVAGLADRPLAQLRTLAAATAGAKAGCGTAVVMVLRDRVDYDPMFAATVPLVGPLGATRLSLERVSGGMASDWAPRGDRRELISLLRVPPRGVKDSLVEDMQRWQRRRLASHLPEGRGEAPWPRAARAIAARMRSAAEKGALRALRAGGHDTNVWQRAHGFLDQEACLACGAQRDAPMHRQRERPATMQPRDEELELEEPLHKPLQTVRRQLEEAERLWTTGDSELPPAHGLPLAPTSPAAAPDQAQCGALPGAPQTVGRAEGHACLSPRQQKGDRRPIASDLSALVKEGSERGASLPPALRHGMQ